MKFSEARAACADLLWRQYDRDLYLQLQTQVMEHLVKASPQVTSLDNGVFLLDASGLTHLGGEQKFCRHVQKLINTTGFADMHIGIADTAFAAQLASKYKQARHYIVPVGKDREFISALSIQHLPISDEMKERFIRLGIKTIGQILQIPVDEIQERFGKEGLHAFDLASGRDKTQPQMVQIKELYEASVDLNFPVESLSQTQFILKSMLESICSRLKADYLLAEELQISFFNSSERFEKRPLKLLRPSNNPKFLLEIVKLSLEATPLAREYTGMHIEVSMLGKESWQQNNMQVVENKQDRRKDHAATFVVESKNADAQAEPFAILLQRFSARLGAKSVVRPVPDDQHIPDLASRFLPLVEETGTILPLNFTAAEGDGAVLACGLVLKKSPSPEPVLVEYQGKALKSISYKGRWFKIKELTEPEKLSGLWWENPVRKSYYVALIEAANEAINYLVLLVHNQTNNSWQLDGFFD